MWEVRSKQWAVGRKQKTFSFSILNFSFVIAEERSVVASSWRQKQCYFGDGSSATLATEACYDETLLTMTNEKFQMENRKCFCFLPFALRLQLTAYSSPLTAYRSLLTAYRSRRKPLPVFNRANKRLDHFRVNEVAVEVVQLGEPKIVAIEIRVRWVVWISAQVTKVLH